jgi:hypothetical protein
MAILVGAEPCLTKRRQGAAAALRLLPWLTLAALFAITLAMRHVLAANTDVSWLLTVAERVLDVSDFMPTSSRPTRRWRC